MEDLFARVQTLPLVNWILPSRIRIKILIDHSCLISLKISCLIKGEFGAASKPKDITSLVKQRRLAEQMVDINSSHMLVASAVEFKPSSKLHQQ